MLYVIGTMSSYTLVVLIFVIFWSFKNIELWQKAEYCLPMLWNMRVVALSINSHEKNLPELFSEIVGSFYY